MQPVLKFIVPTDADALRQLVHDAKCTAEAAQHGVIAFDQCCHHYIRTGNLCELDVGNIVLVTDTGGHHVAPLELFLECEPRLRGHGRRIGIEIGQRDQRATEIVATGTFEHHFKPFVNFRHRPLHCDFFYVFHRFINELDFAQMLIREGNREHPLFRADRTLRGIEGRHGRIGCRGSAFFTEGIFVVFQDGGAIVAFAGLCEPTREFFHTDVDFYILVPVCHRIVKRRERGAGLGVIDTVECPGTFPAGAAFCFPCRCCDLRGITYAPIRVQTHLFEYKFLGRIAKHIFAPCGPDTRGGVALCRHIEVVLDDFHRG